MGRVLRLARGFFDSFERVGVAPGTPVARKIARTLRALDSAGELPSAGDHEVFLPPALRLYSRRVPGESLWLLYSIDASLVTVRWLVNTPPEPY